MRTLRLPETIVDKLINLPETGMGYHIVKVILRSGEILRQHKVLNSSLLILEDNEQFTEKEIEKVEPEARK